MKLYLFKVYEKENDLWGIIASGSKAVIEKVYKDYAKNYYRVTPIYVRITHEGYIII